MQKLLDSRQKEKFSIKKVLNVFTWFDLHGSEISVNFEGETRYRTYLGSICTIMTFMAAIIYTNLRY